MTENGVVGTAHGRSNSAEGKAGCWHPQYQEGSSAKYLMIKEANAQALEAQLESNHKRQIFSSMPEMWEW